MRKRTAQNWTTLFPVLCLAFTPSSPIMPNCQFIILSVILARAILSVEFFNFHLIKQQSPITNKFSKRDVVNFEASGGTG